MAESTPSDCFIAAQKALWELYNAKQPKSLTQSSCEPKLKHSYCTRIETEMDDDEYDAYFMVTRVDKDEVHITWFFDAADNPDEGIPPHLFRHVPPEARKGFWFSNVGETWTLDHFQDVVVRPVANISWPCTGWDPDVELNVTGFYNPDMPRAQDKVSHVAMPVLDEAARKRRRTHAV